jgi:hypothetical protein
MGRFMPQTGMSNDNATYPYTLTILPCDRLAGHFEWDIRNHGKLVQRSDWPHRSERSARENGQTALERQFRANCEPARGFRS